MYRTAGECKTRSAVGVQCSSSYTLKDVGVHVEDVGVQCSILPWPIMGTSSTPLKPYLPSDTSQSESDTDLDGGSEYTLSQEDTSDTL